MNKNLLACFFVSVLLISINRTYGANRYWIGANNGSWNSASNWNTLSGGGGSNGVPAAGDLVIFDSNSGSDNVLVDVNPAAIGQLWIKDNVSITLTCSGSARTLTIGDNTANSITGASAANADFVVENGSTLTISGPGAAMIVTQNNNVNSAADILGTIIVNQSGSLTKAATPTFTFNSGSEYQHARNGGTIPTGVTWNSSSTCRITGMTNTSPSSFAVDPSFGNFIWNCSSQSANHTLCNAGINLTINGNFSVLRTGATSSLIHTSANGSPTLKIVGDFTIGDGVNNAIFDEKSGGNGSNIVNLGGNLLVNASATLTSTDNGVTSFNFGYTGATTSTNVNWGGAGTYTNTNITYVIQNEPANKAVSLTSNQSIPTGNSVVVNTGATINLSTFVISGAGGFTLNTGTTIITAHLSGLSTTASTGSIQTNTLSFNSGANYTFNGGGAQLTGNFLSSTTPTTNTVNNLTCSNSSGLTLSANCQVNGAFSILSGNFNCNTFNLTLNGTTSCSGTISASASSTVSYASTATNIITGTYYNLAITAGSPSTACGALAITNSFSIASGTLNTAYDISIGDNSSSACGTGTIVASAGTVTYSRTTGGQKIAGGSYNNLTLSNSSGTNTACGNITVAGTFTANNGGILDMTNAYTLGGAWSSINNTGTIQTGVPTSTSATPIPTGITWPGTVTYTGAAAQTVMGGTYNNLTLNGGNGIDKTMSGNVTVTNSLTLTSGLLALSTNNLYINSAATISGGSTNSFISTNSTGVVYKYLTTTGSVTYPLGTSTRYTPATINFTAGTYAGGAYLSIRAVPSVEPNIADPSVALSKYWEVATSGITGINASLSFTYDNAEINGTEASYDDGVYNGGWTNPGSVTAASNLISESYTGVSNLNGNYTAGINPTAFSITTFYSLGGNWENATSWSTAGFAGVAAGTSPTANCKVVIGNGKTITKTTSTALTIKILQIDATGILDMGTQTGLTVTTFSSAGTGGNGTIQFSAAAAGQITYLTVTTDNFIASSTSTVEFNGTTSYDFPNSPTAFPNLKISGGSGTKSSKANFTVAGTLNIAASTTLEVKHTLTVSGNVSIYGTFSLNANKAVAFSSACTIFGTGTINSTTNNAPITTTGLTTIYEGGTLSGPTAKFDYTANGGLTIEDNGSAFATIGAVNLTVGSVGSPQTTTLNGNLTFVGSGNGKKIFIGNIIINTNGVWDNAVGEDPELNGNITNNGSWIGCTGGSCDYKYGKQLAGTYTISGNAVAISILTIQTNTTVINSGTLVVATQIKTGGGAPNTFTNSATGILYLSASSATVATLVNTTFNVSAVGNVVHYDCAGAQNIVNPSDGSYSNLVLENSGAKAIVTSPLTVNSMLSMSGSASMTVGAAQSLTGTGGLNMTGTSVLTIQQCTPATQPQLSGTYTLTGGTIVFDGACNQTANSTPSGATTYYGITCSNSGAKDLCGVTNINGDLTISGSATIANSCATVITQACTGTFNYGSSGVTTLGANLNTGNVNITAGTLNDGGRNITVCGSSWANAGTFTSTGTATFNGATTISGASVTNFNNVVINSSKSLTGHATSFSVKGNWTNNGTYSHNSGTVVFNGTTNITGSSTTQFNNLTLNNGNSITITSNIELVGNWLNSNGAGGISGLGTISFTGGNSQTITCGSQTFGGLTVNKTAGTTLTLSGSQTVSTAFTLTEGIFIAGTNTFNGVASFTQTSGEIRLAKITTVPELTGAYSITGGQVTLNGAGDQTLYTVGTGTFYDLEFSNSGNKTITGLTTINGDVDVLGSAILLNNSSFTQLSSKLFTYSSSGNTQFTAATNVSFGKVLVTAGTLNINGITADVTGSTFTHTGGTITTNGTFQFNGAVAQTYSGSNTFSNVIVNNANHLNLASDLTVQTSLDFTQGNIVTTTSYKVTLNSGGMVNRTTGHVDGNFRKYLTAANDVVNYEVGFSSNYTPLSFAFAGATTGQTLTCASTSGDHPQVFASTMDPNKTVNCYWTLSGTPGGSADITYNYPSSILDPLAIPANFYVNNYVAPFWDTIKANPTPTNIIATVSGITNFNVDQQLGAQFTPSALYNSQTGTIPWNDQNSWIRYRTGNIAYNAGSNAVVGTGTSFTTELVVGEILVSQSSPTVAIGTIASITDDNNLVLTGNASGTNASDSYGVKAIPNATDEVKIGNGYIAAGDVTVQLDVDASIYKLNLTNEVAANSTLIHLSNFTLTTSSSALIKQPPGAFINNWNIAAGTGTIAGNVQIGSNDNGAGRIAKVSQSTGTLTIGANLVMYHGNTIPNSVLDLSDAGSGTTNLKGTIVLTGGDGTYTKTSNDIFRYNGSASGQTVKNSLSFNYANLYLANSHTAGVGLQANITSTEVSANINVESGLFKNNGYNITGTGTNTFTVSNGATFQMSGSSTFPPSFTTYTFGATSTTKYFQTAPTVIDAQTYGYLYIQPQANSVTHTYETGITRSQSHMYIGDGVYTSIIADASSSTQLRIDSSLFIYTGATLTAPSANLLMYGDFTNNGTFAHNSGTAYIIGTPATQTITNNSASTLNFNNLIKHAASTSALTFAGSLTTLNIISNLTLSNGTVNPGTLTTINVTGNITHNGATVNAPSTINLTGSFTTSSGTFNSGTDFNILGNWTNNGGTFNPGTGTVKFYNVATARSITGTAVTHSFNNLFIMTAPQNFSITGATTLNISGDLRDSSGTGTPITWPTNIVFNGTSVSQRLYRPTASSTAYTMTNLTINNTTNSGTELTLNVPINLSGTLTLTDGIIVTTTTKVITMGTAGSISGGSDASHVSGPLNHTFNSTTPTTKVYPVGKGGLLRQTDLTIDLTAATNTIFSAEYFSSSARDLGYTLPAGINRVSGIGYWDISGVTAYSVASASVKLYYISLDEVSNAANLRVCKGNPSVWTNIGGTGTAAPTGNITSTVNFTTFSKFSLASTDNSNVLPVYLVNFKAKKKENEVLLTWETKAEKNNDYFEVQRSANGLDFETIGFVKGNGTTVNTNKYSYIDNNPLSGTNFYRLKQVDFDTKFELSNIVKVEFENLTETISPIVKIFPNPSDGKNFKIDLVNFEEEVLVVLRDISGKEVYAKVVVTHINNSFEGHEIHNELPPGIYLITASNDNQLVSERIIVK